MQIDNILIVSPPGYIHNQCLFDIALSFQSAFKQLGQEVPVVIDPNYCQEGKTLVFGAHLLPKHGGTIDDGDYIIYQTEQIGVEGSLFVDEAYLDILKRFPVWDYSLTNIDSLFTNYGIKATHVPIGYSRCMSNIKTGRSASIVGGGKNGKQRIEFAEWSGIYPAVDHNGKFVQDVDVCFYGSMNERRKNIIDALKECEVNGRKLTVANFIGYGGFRDKIVARSKIVLNMHYYENAIFESIRCSHLFANKKCVVSEGPIPESYVPATSYENLVERCMFLLNNPDLRENTATDSYESFKKTSQSDILKNVLS